jgi:hypothetical protein
MWKWVYCGLGVLACLCVLSFLTPVPIAPAHHITWESFKRLSADMTERDVVELLGVPAGDYNTVPVAGPPCGNGLPAPNMYGPITAVVTWKEWKSNEVILSAGFDRNGNLLYADCVWAFPVIESFPTKLRRWLRL